MTYPWEPCITPAMLEQINAILPTGIVLRGVAVENITQVEAALIERTADGYPDSIAPVDVWQDIQGDAFRIADGYRAQSAAKYKA